MLLLFAYCVYLLLLGHSLGIDSDVRLSSDNAISHSTITNPPLATQAESVHFVFLLSASSAWNIRPELTPSIPSNLTDCLHYEPACSQGFSDSAAADARRDGYLPRLFTFLLPPNTIRARVGLSTQLHGFERFQPPATMTQYEF